MKFDRRTVLGGVIVTLLGRAWLLPDFGSEPPEAAPARGNRPGDRQIQDRLGVRRSIRGEA